MSVKRTPTQHLVLEVLAARYRLGDRLWTFPTTVRPTLTSLSALGLVSLASGITEHTVRAALTDAGIAEVLMPGYKPSDPSPARWDMSARHAERAQATYVELRQSATSRTVALGPGVNVDVDVNGAPIGVEFFWPKGRP